MAEKDYPYIRAWGAIMGSYPYYIKDQVAKAREIDAPEDTIYFHETDGKLEPRTLRTMNNEPLKKQLIARVENGLENE